MSFCLNYKIPFFGFQLWITKKSSLLLSVEEVTNMKDLATVMILQRRLNSIQRDVGPLEDKVISAFPASRVFAYFNSAIAWRRFSAAKHTGHWNKESAMFKYPIRSMIFSQLEITGNYSQKAGNSALGTPELKISRGHDPRIPREPRSLAR